MSLCCFHWQVIDKLHVKSCEKDVLCMFAADSIKNLKKTNLEVVSLSNDIKVEFILWSHVYYVYTLTIDQTKDVITRLTILLAYSVFPLLT